MLQKNFFHSNFADDNQKTNNNKQLIVYAEITVAYITPAYLFDNRLIYRFTTDSENTWSWGGLTTYYLSADGTVTYDKRYTWHVSDPANEEDGNPRIELTWFDAPDSDDLWDATEYYIVVRLTPTEMWLKRFQKGLSDDIKKFIRRNDLPAPSKPQVWSD